MTEQQTVDERARDVIGRWLWLLPREIPRTEAGTHVDHVMCQLTAAGIALVDAAELEALLTFAAASRKEYVWRRCREEAKRRQHDYRPEQMEQWEKQYAEWWDDDHADVAAILQRRNEVTDD